MAYFPQRMALVHIFCGSVIRYQHDDVGKSLCKTLHWKVARNIAEALLQIFSSTVVYVFK